MKKTRRRYMSISITASDFLEFKRIQKNGSYNMLDPRAREMSNLSKEQWVTIIADYNKLNEAWGETPPVITGDKDTDSLLEDERANNE
tara:strand:- start:2825 stop:3088 length:264 start_codon:yes stop_codon:yes gene_type:complete